MEISQIRKYIEIIKTLIRNLKNDDAILCYISIANLPIVHKSLDLFL